MRFFFSAKEKKKKKEGKKPAQEVLSSDDKEESLQKEGSGAFENRGEESRQPQTDNASDVAGTLSEISSVLENADSFVSPSPKKKLSEAPRELSEKEKKKKQDRSLYESLLSGLYDAVLIIDTNGSVIGSNRRAELFFSYGERELWNMRCESLIGAVNQRVLTKIQAHAESGRFTVVNASCKRKDGTTFPAEIAIGRIDLLNRGDLLFSIRNLERKERAQKRNRLELDAIRHTATGIAVCNREGMIEYVNPGFVRLLRLQNESDVLQRFIGEFCASHEAAGALIKTPSSQGNWMGSLALLADDGGERKVIATAASTRQRKGESHVVITMTPLPQSVSHSRLG
ncbi:MAG: PAS domain-containing protein [Verrucomicrobiota bacterium]